MRQALTSLDGVVAAEVSFDESRAVVRYHPDVTTAEAMITAIEGAGFEARLAEGRHAPNQP